MTTIPTRDILWTSPYTDPDRASYGEQPSAKELVLRVAATPKGSGTLITRRTSVSQIVEAERTGRSLHLLTSATGWVADSNVTVTTAAQQPTGYSGNSLAVQGTGASSTDRGARYTFSTALDLSVFGGGALIRVHRRITSVTNLTRAVLRFEFATTSDWAEYELAPSGATINTWSEIVVGKGTPRATNGTVDWANVTAIRLFLDVSGAYTGDLQVRALRMGTVETAKGTPDGAFAWETSIDARARYRDNADAKASTTLAAASSAGATNVKVASVSNLAVGDELTIATAGLVETRTITTVGTSGAGGTGITVSEAYTFAHGSGDTVEVRYWGPWSSWLTVKASQPPTVAADTPADRALITDPTPALAHTYSSPASKAQASRTTDVYRRLGHAARVLASGPSSFWRLGEASGSAVDSAGAITGTVGGTTTRNVTGALSPADGNGAIDLDGSTGSVSLGDVYGFEGTAAFTAACWVYVDTPAGYGRLFAKEQGATREGWTVWVHTDGTVGFERFVGGVNTGSCIAPAGSVPDATWTHVAAVYDGTAKRLYINGTLAASADDDGSMIDNAYLLHLGQRGNGSSWLNGKLDEAAIWSRALSAAAVANLAGSRLEAPGDQLWRSSTASGTGLSDTLPAFLLESDEAYAWEKTAADSDGLTDATDRRSFTTAFTIPDAVANLAGTADAEAGTIELTWDASADPNLHHYRVYWQDARGDWIRIDEGPAEVDDGRTPLTTAALTVTRARIGYNAFQVTVHNGALESEEAQVVVTLGAPPAGGSWMLVDELDGRYTTPLRIMEAPRVRESVIERFTPPGRGSTIHLSWGIHARRVSARVRIRPSTEGDLALLLDQLQDAAAGVWLKAPAGWLWDPMWVRVTGSTDVPGTGGMMELAVEFEEAER